MVKSFVRSVVIIFVFFNLCIMSANVNETHISIDGTLQSSTQNCGHREGEKYVLCMSHIDQFRTKGLTILENFLTKVTSATF